PAPPPTAPPPPDPPPAPPPPPPFKKGLRRAPIEKLRRNQPLGGGRADEYPCSHSPRLAPTAAARQTRSRLADRFSLSGAAPAGSRCLASLAGYLCCLGFSERDELAEGPIAIRRPQRSKDVANSADKI